MRLLKADGERDINIILMWFLHHSQNFRTFTFVPFF